jgi:hypothetical protein
MTKYSLKFYLTNGKTISLYIMHKDSDLTIVRTKFDNSIQTVKSAGGSLSVPDIDGTHYVLYPEFLIGFSIS